MTLNHIPLAVCDERAEHPARDGESRWFPIVDQGLPAQLELYTVGTDKYSAIHVRIHNRFLARKVREFSHCYSVNFSDYHIVRDLGFI